MNDAQGQGMAPDYLAKCKEYGAEWEAEGGYPEGAARKMVHDLCAEVERLLTEADRRKGYGPGFRAMVEAARPLAERIVDSVRVNTPDRTGMGVVSIAANNIAAFACEAVEEDRGRCIGIIRQFDPPETYVSDEDGNEPPERLGWEAIRDALIAKLDEGK